MVVEQQSNNNLKGQNMEDEWDEIERFIHECAGEYSMCWSEIPVGIFESSKALEISHKLLDFIKNRCDVKP